MKRVAEVDRMFDTAKDVRKSQSELISAELERLTWHSSHPARKREEARRRQKEKRNGT